MKKDFILTFTETKQTVYFVFAETADEAIRNYKAKGQKIIEGEIRTKIDVVINDSREKN